MNAPKVDVADTMKMLLGTGKVCRKVYIAQTNFLGFPTMKKICEEIEDILAKIAFHQANLNKVTKISWE